VIFGVAPEKRSYTHHIRLGNPAVIPIIILEQIRPHMQGSELQIRKTPVLYQPITAAKGQSNQHIRQL
jgi:hypothetical protein